MPSAALTSSIGSLCESLESTHDGAAARRVVELLETHDPQASEHIVALLRGLAGRDRPGAGIQAGDKLVALLEDEVARNAALIAELRERRVAR